MDSLKEFTVGILTVSDRCSRGEKEDLSGPAIATYLQGKGFCVNKTSLVPDENQKITAEILNFCDREKLDLVLTTGGTGFAPRDITPEVTSALCTRLAPGIAEAIRAYSMTKTKHAILSRGVAGIRGNTLIINLPGSPKACTEGLDAIIGALPHALGLLAGQKLDS